LTTRLASSCPGADDVPAYRTSARETERVADLLALVPASGTVALDVGTRDGHLARLLAARYGVVVALDIVRPRVEHPGVERVQGDITALPFGDDRFDVVLCAEVLEHISPELLEKACRELTRVTRGSLVVGVPYRQDLRCGATTCGTCGAVNPPWSHVNTFDEARLGDLFAPLSATETSYVGSTHEITNPVSAALMNFAGNPFGTYEQEETCAYCHSELHVPLGRTRTQRVATRAAFVINKLQRQFARPHANWIQIRFDKTPSGSPTAR